MKQADNRRKLINCVNALISKEKSVLFYWVGGSEKFGKSHLLSDIDMWIVVKNESDIFTSKEVKGILGKAAPLKGIYQSAPGHYFITFNGNLQLDLNIVSSTVYHNVKKAPKIAINPPPNSARDRSTKIEGDYKKLQASPEDLLLFGYTTLARAVPKYSKSNYFVTCRFIDDVRNNALIPLFDRTKIQIQKTPISFSVNRLPANLKNLFLHTFPKPEKSSCKMALNCSVELLDFFSKETGQKKFKQFSKQINQYITKTI
jgi:hypothetical protein